MDSEYGVNIPLSAICNHLNDDLNALEELLVCLGYAEKIHRRTKELRIFCPNCSTARSDKYSPGLQIKFQDGRVKWTCYNCKIQKKKFDNLIGLYRLLFDEPNPWVAVNKLFDQSFAHKSKSDKRFPIAVDDYKGKLLHEVPPSKLYWTAMDASISEEQRKDIFDYLVGVAPF